MAKRSRKTHEQTLHRRLREGRGQGNGAAYKPWLTVQDVASVGLSHRIRGWTTGRVHHLLSNLERDVFYVLDWSEAVLDIREQYPLLPLTETEALAQQLGVRHPRSPRTQSLIVMTTDFLVDVRVGNVTIQQARSVKPAEHLKRPRILEKLEIERRYWQARGVDWGVVTEYEIPKPETDNLRLLHAYQRLDDRLPENVNCASIAQFLLDTKCPQRLDELTRSGDSQLQLAAGTTLTVLYHLLATRQFPFRLSESLTEQSLLPLAREGLA